VLTRACLIILAVQAQECQTLSGKFLPNGVGWNVGIWQTKPHALISRLVAISDVFISEGKAHSREQTILALLVRTP
jgi:hypothetical protein